MKTPEEIKKALKLHKGGSACGKCPYYGSFYDDYACMPGLITDVLALIEKLEEQVMLMKIQMRGDCGCCKHRGKVEVTTTGEKGEYHLSRECAGCLNKEDRPNWEYEGLPELPKKGATT